MKKILLIIISLFLWACPYGSLHAGYVVTNITRFLAAPDGLHPHSGLVKAKDGSYYGTAYDGGEFGYGTVFRFIPGTPIETLLSFDGIHGGYPLGELVVADDGNFYGTTSSGGAFGYGTVFRLAPDGVFSVLASFNGKNGQFPVSGLIRGPDGNLYGTTSQGGPDFDSERPPIIPPAFDPSIPRDPIFLGGTVFKITLEGVLTTLIPFDYGTDPEGGLIFGKDGNIYGTTAGGGTNGVGSIFKITSSGTLTTLFSFNGSNGRAPNTRLIQASDDNFYGVTSGGGIFSGGTAFKLTRDGSFTNLVSFYNENSMPSGALVQGSDGNFYGASNGGSWGKGVIYKLAPTGALTTLMNFTNSDLKGKRPSGCLVQNENGGFYGVTVEGGDYDMGTIFSIASTGGFSNQFTFQNTISYYPIGPLTQTRDGTLYGTTGGGGYANAGTIFKLGPNGEIKHLFSFDGVNGFGPTGALIEGNNGHLYGTTRYGGGLGGWGTVYEMTPEGVVSIIARFTGPNGKNPEGGVIQAQDGSIYGTTRAGGSFGLGTVFKINTDGSMSTLISFSGKNGSGPQGALLQASDGNFYSTTSGGGTFGLGAVFKLTPKGVLTTLLNFGNDTAYPLDLILGKDGNLYGSGFTFGPYTQVTLYRINLTGAFSRITTFSQSDGLIPRSLIYDSKGNLYVILGGAQFNRMFRVEPDGNSAILATIGDVSETIVGCMRANDGSFYGTTFGGGPTSYGSIFRMEKNSQTISFDRLTNQVFGNSPIRLHAVASSGLPVSFRVVSGPAAISGEILTILGGGRITVAAGQTGSEDFAPAIEVGRSFNVVPASQTITFPSIGVTDLSRTISLKATASSGLPVTYRILEGPAHISGNLMTFFGSGRVRVLSEQAGNSDFKSARSVGINVMVQRAKQSLAPFVVIGNQLYPSTPFQIALPESTSGLPVTVSVKSGPAKLIGNTITLTGIGGVRLVALQSGDSYYSAAEAVTTAFQVKSASRVGTSTP